MDTELLYNNFMEKYSDYPKKLAELIARQKDDFVKTAETATYNLGTMQKDEDISLSQNIVVINAYEFKSAYESYQRQNSQMSDIEAKSRVVFDFLQKHGSSLTYDKNKDDFLFKNPEDSTDVTREQFYANSIYKNALTNTNFFDRHIGDMQLMCIEPKTADDLPRNLDGAPQDVINNFFSVAPEERTEILYKRGLYHEGIHVAMGTTDERKCDAFALLKIMREHPKSAKAIFDIYNHQRSKMGYTVECLAGKDIGSFQYQRAVKGGAMTYLMPNTYKKLRAYALSPEKIPADDAGLLDLTCRLTAGTEFSQKQLDAFSKLLSQKSLSPEVLEKNEIVKLCMEQGGFRDISSYLNSDKRLKQLLRKHHSQKVSEKIADIKIRLEEKTSSAVYELRGISVSAKVPYKPRSISKENLRGLHYVSNRKVDGSR